MDFNQIDLLLEKFWEGNTSLEEENQLKAFFLNTHDLPSKYDADKNYFAFLSKEQKINIPSADFDQQLNTRIAKEQPKKAVSKLRYLYLNFTSVAAAILIVGGSLVYMMRPSNTEILMTIERNGNTIQITDPNEALQMTKASFKSINKTMRQSKKKLRPVKNIRKIDIIK